ncbi:MAG TPA: orotidine-5'-phosphate decarboxylase [Oligoflexia bacterium]|nr:orotidine-5'-phosphate decarboxylase [Oligoflexia bacterium]
MSFRKMLEDAWAGQNSLVCVGLDTDLKKIPVHLLSAERPIFEFNKAIVDATAEMVCAFKPQIAYYAARAAEDQLLATISYIHDKYPGIPVILDAKRGDIGATAELYAQEAFIRYGADAVTVNPYLGFDSVEPFLRYEDKGVVLLCRTSNPGAKDFQDLRVGTQTLYQHIAMTVSEKWNSRGNAMLVVGATYPKELAEVREIAPDVPFLVPGVGAQGGDVEAAVSNGKDRAGTGMVINSSRGIIYASSGKDFAEAARCEAMKLRDEINRFR